MASFFGSRSWLALAAGAVVAAACGSDEGPTPGAVTSSAASGGGSTLPEPAVHRPQALPCSGTPPPGNAVPMAGTECDEDGDCTAGENGRCNWPFGGDNLCMYDECFEDADCGPASVCACRIEESFGMNRCFHGNCVLDEDCGVGGYCSPSAVTITPSCMEGIAPGSIGFYCHTAEDECTDDADCGDPQGFACLFRADQARWMCHTLLCTN